MDDPISRVQEVRRRISNEHNNDTRELLAYYQALQERHRDRLLPAVDSEAVGVPAQQQHAADGATRRR